MRFTTLAVASVLVASVLGPTGSVAHAAPAGADGTAATCSMKPPARISLAAAQTLVSIPLGSDCPSTVQHARWYINWSNGIQQDLDCWDGEPCRLSLSTRTTPAQQVTFEPDPYGATDASGARVATLIQAYSAVRFASSASVNAGRKGTRTAFITTVWWFSPTTNTFVRWGGRRVLLQYQEIGTSTWKGLAYLTTNASGQASYTYYPGRTRRYRLYVPASTSVWDFYTPSISR
ncbi:hypothetical protein [Kribbella swartbergensis]